MAVTWSVTGGKWSETRSRSVHGQLEISCDCIEKSEGKEKGKWFGKRNPLNCETGEM
jgi:hypothetical protein